MRMRRIQIFPFLTSPMLSRALSARLGRMLHRGGCTPSTRLFAPSLSNPVRFASLALLRRSQSSLFSSPLAIAPPSSRAAAAVCHFSTESPPLKKGEALKKFARDLTADAKAGKLDPVIGRDAEITRTIQVLSRRTKCNPVLIGEPGVGKTALAEGLAIRIAEGLVPDSIKNKRVMSLDISQIVGALGE